MVVNDTLILPLVLFTPFSIVFPLILKANLVLVTSSLPVSSMIVAFIVVLWLVVVMLFSFMFTAFLSSFSVPVVSLRS